MKNSIFQSVLLHTALVMAAISVTPPIIESHKDEIVIDVIEPIKSQPEEKAQLIKNIEDQLPEKKHTPQPVQASSLVTAKLDTEVKAPTKTSSQSKTKISKMKTTTGPVVKSTSHLAKSAPSRAGVPETLEDIAAPDLDFDGLEVAQAGQLGEDEFEDEFKNIDRKSEAVIKAQHSEFDNEIRNISDEAEQKLAGIENENKNQARVMRDSLEATRTKNSALLAKIKAGEDALARKAAQEKKIRSVESLRQMAGNPKPKYSMEERFRKEQGTVVFQAYVTPEGSLKDFKLIQSTGYKNLDGKTLAALRKWKFYPGQQGWVEIPQTWTLKGEEQEMPATLRRKITQR